MHTRRFFHYTISINRNGSPVIPPSSKLARPPASASVLYTVLFGLHSSSSASRWKVSGRNDSRMRQLSAPGQSSSYSRQKP